MKTPKVIVTFVFMLLIVNCRSEEKKELFKLHVKNETIDERINLKISIEQNGEKYFIIVEEWSKRFRLNEAELSARSLACGGCIPGTQLLISKYKKKSVQITKLFFEEYQNKVFNKIQNSKSMSKKFCAEQRMSHNPFFGGSIELFLNSKYSLRLNKTYDHRNHKCPFLIEGPLLSSVSRDYASYERWNLILLASWNLMADRRHRKEFLDFRTLNFENFNKNNVYKELSVLGKFFNGLDLLD